MDAAWFTRLFGCRGRLVNARNHYSWGYLSEAAETSEASADCNGVTFIKSVADLSDTFNDRRKMWRSAAAIYAIGANFEFLDQGLEEPHEYAKIQ